jgi:hypothetical protein
MSTKLIDTELPKFPANWNKLSDFEKGVLTLQKRISHYESMPTQHSWVIREIETCKLKLARLVREWAEEMVEGK